MLPPRVEASPANGSSGFNGTKPASSKLSANDQTVNEFTIPAIEILLPVTAPEMLAVFEVAFPAATPAPAVALLSNVERQSLLATGLDTEQVEVGSRHVLAAAKSKSTCVTPKNPEKKG